MNAAEGNRSPSPRWAFWRWKLHWQILVASIEGERHLLKAPTA